MIHLVGHSCELERPGDFLRLQFGRRDIIVQRDDGGVWAFENVCPHRGARILDDAAGCQRPVCPYHGRLTTRDNTPTRFGVITANGWVFVEDHAMVRPRVPELFTSHSLRAALANSGAVYKAATYHRTLACDWATAVENALDWTHVRHVHGDSLARMELHPVGGIRGEYGTSAESFSSSTAARLWRLTDTVGERGLHEYVHAYVTPYACLAATCGIAFSLQTYMPTDGGIAFATRLYMPLGLRGAEEISAQVGRLNKQVFDEDAAVCERIRHVQAMPLTDSEWRIAHFRGGAC